MTSTLEVGSIVRDRYFIQQIIKQAQFEKVYLAEDRSHSSENCILKEFIARETGSAAQVGAAFQAELSAITSIKHPQLQQLKDFFWESDRLFLVTTYVEGQTYQNWLRSRPTLTESEAIQLLNQILPALSYLHSQQITHRDISPNNLILRIPDNLPVLTNFGVTRDIMTQLRVETIKTRLLDEVNSLPLGFIAPGVGEDLYALAITVIMLLTGKEIPDLFNTATQTWDWERWKLVSDRLAQVLNRMLAVEVRDRFPSADSILPALNPAFPAPIPIPPAFANPYTPTEIAPPPNSINWSETATATTITKKDSDKTWLIALIIGSLLTLVGVLAVILVKGLPGTEKATVTASPTIIAPSSTPEPPKPAELTQTQAVNLLNDYLQAKAKIFAPPFDRQLAANFTTGKIYEDMIKPGGSLDWLQENNAYYGYGVRKAEPLGYFSTSGDLAQIDISITEDYSYYIGGQLQEAKTNFKSYRFTLRRENGTWKLAERVSL